MTSTPLKLTEPKPSPLIVVLKNLSLTDTTFLLFGFPYIRIEQRSSGPTKEG